MAGDGTTSVTVICGALLKKCLELLERGIHPTIISDAFATAAEKSLQVSAFAWMLQGKDAWGKGAKLFYLLNVAFGKG